MARWIYGVSVVVVDTVVERDTAPCAIKNGESGVRSIFSTIFAHFANTRENGGFAKCAQIVFVFFAPHQKSRVQSACVEVSCT